LTLVKKKVTYHHNNKTATVRTLSRRAQVFCDSPDSVTDEIKYSEMAFMKKNLSKDFIRRNTYNEPNDVWKNSTPITTVTIPHIKGSSGTIAHKLQTYNIINL